MEFDSKSRETHPLNTIFLDRQGRMRASWRFLLFAFFYLALTVLAGWLLAPSIIAAAAGQPEKLIALELCVTVIVGLIAVFGATILMLRAVDHRGFDFVGLGSAPNWGSQLVVGFLFGIALMSVIVALEFFTGHLRLSPAAPLPVSARWLAFTFVLFAVGSTHEEMLFRGYAFQRMVDVLGAPGATLVLAALFGVAHLGNPNAGAVGAANTALVGILFALLYLRSGRLWLPIGVHWGWNFTEAGYGVPVSGITIGEMPLRAQYQGSSLFHGGAYGPEASIFATAVIAAAILAVLSWKPAVAQQVSKE